MFIFESSIKSNYFMKKESLKLNVSQARALGQWLNLNRVYQIAAISNLPIALTFNSFYNGWENDIKVIRELYSDVTFIELSNEQISAYNGKCLKISIDHNDGKSYIDRDMLPLLDEIKTGILEAKSFINKDFGPAIKNDNIYVVDALIKTARTKLNINYIDYDLDVKSLARYIAILDKSYKIIEVSHIAEAIQYLIPLGGDDFILNPYDNKIMFGNDFIKMDINKAALKDDYNIIDFDLAIDKAIEYLNSLKK